MNYMICGTGRARTGILAKYLRKLGLGAPDEFYEHARHDLHLLTEEAAVRDYIEARRVNSVFGIKMVWSHVARMHKSLGLKLPEFIDTYMPKPVYLFQTRDPMLQAIESMIYGMQRDGLSLKRQHFDLDVFKQRVARILIGNQAWRVFFERQGVSPIHVDAAELEADPVPVLKDIYRQLGIPYPDVAIKNTFSDALMNAFRDEVYSVSLRRHQMLMNDIDVKEFL